MNLKKVCIFAVIALVVLISAIIIINIDNTSKDEKENLKEISVSEVTRSVFYAPQYVAIAGGYFEEEGLKINLTTGQGSDNVMTGVLSNQIDIGFAGPETCVYVYNEGKEDYAQVFAQVTQTDGSFLVSSKKIDNFKWSDLKGKTVIPGRKGGMPYMSLLYVLKKNGINPSKDLKLDDSIDFDLMASAFSTGKADFVTLFEPTTSQIISSGKGYMVTSIGKELGKVPYTAYFAKKSYIEKNTDVIQKFTNAIYKGEQYVKNHTSKEIAELIKEFFPDSDIKVLESAIESYRKINAWKDTPYMEEADFKLLQDVIHDAGELNKYAPYENVVNNAYKK
ncbi:MAG: ABC transporter substrate-binding protein [Clostridia bacterium]|nr:ABC transporter substrate-binding protein [Clostridia bacterium]